jgi:iron complex outermembrane receptor protein
MQVRDQSRSFKRAMKPCVLFLALLPCLTAYARNDDVATAKFNIPQQQLGAALSEYARQSGKQLLYAPELAAGKTAHAVQGDKTPTQALQELLAGTGLDYATNASGAILISDRTNSNVVGAEAKPAAAETQGNAQEVAEAQPAAPSQEVEAQQAAPEATASQSRSGSATTLDTIVVTAQKKVENIQKVPIAITAFGGEELNDRKIETGADLVTATPNVSFSKTNFASYNFQIRGIGTQALSVTTDPAVAISFNSAPMIRNRLFEQEYFDVQRVEVLRGPQGTLYGRNATAGVVNMIPNIADPSAFSADTKGEFGNYSTTRVNAMVNVPLSDTFAFRVATQYTKRDGFDHNTATGQDVNDRDILGVRTSLAWKPSDRFNASFIWDHFQEDDNRSRTGKQLCHNDPGPTSIGSVTLRPNDIGFLSQACKDGSLYDDGAFGVPNGNSLPSVLAAQTTAGALGYYADTFNPAYLIAQGTDPFAGVTQSRDLRKIATSYDPKFQAKNDTLQLNFDIGIGDHLNFVSQTLYTRDQYYSTQDYGRFQSNPIFTDSNKVLQFDPAGNLVPAYPLTPNGVFCDPQLGCSDRLMLVDLVDADSRQWSQEFRLQSSYDGPFNFSVGANYLEFKIDESYYVFSNLFTAAAQNFFNGRGGVLSPATCAPGTALSVETDAFGRHFPCIYIDPNPLRGINGQGHNYFRSRNVANTRSSAIFGEGYWQINDKWKLTAGLRWTRDVKTTTPVPSQLLLADSTVPDMPLLGGGYVGYGYPAGKKIEQTWNEPTGRLVLDWSPDLSFTDSTMLYASLSRGYKAGGTNSPGIGANPAVLSFVPKDPRFKAEYVNAFEIGMKNVMGGGQFILNATAFYNDYKDYQISQIIDRQTVNENFDAKTWGAEIEAVWRPTSQFQLSGNIGLLRTRIGSNQYSIDVMDRTAGNPDWVVVRPWMQLASNCIAPKAMVETFFENFYQIFDESSLANYLNSFCTVNLPTGLGGFTQDRGLNGGPGDNAWLLGGLYYNPETDAPNGGAGFAKNVGGKELPNAPKITVSLSPQYTFALPDSDLTLRADLYYQGKSWARVYQDRIDRLHDWGNVNLSLTWYRPSSDLTVQLYVKNALDGEAITGTFLNSDDSGLTSNVFLQDPRIFGLSVRKGFY